MLPAIALNGDTYLLPPINSNQEHADASCPYLLRGILLSTFLSNGGTKLHQMFTQHFPVFLLHICWLFKFVASLVVAKRGARVKGKSHPADYTYLQQIFDRFARRSRGEKQSEKWKQIKPTNIKRTGWSSSWCTVSCCSVDWFVCMLMRLNE